MKYDCFLQAKHNLIKQMEQRELSPKEPLIIDNQRHTFFVCLNGQLHKATYLASLDSFGSGHMILICSYGLICSRQQYTFSQSIQEFTA